MPTTRKRKRFSLRKIKASPRKTPLQLAKTAENLSACATVLNEYLHIETLQKTISKNLTQIDRLLKKRETIDNLLLQKFSPDEISYKKFDHVLTSVDNVVYLNLRSIINKISTFDYDEYKEIENLEWNCDDLAKEKMAIFGQYIDFINSATRDNEEIILKLDRLLLEITHFNSVGTDDIMDMPAIADLDKLIKDAKRYR
jgi:hypothetical protein